MSIDHLTPLTPLSYLERSALVFGDRIAVVDGEDEFSYAELFDRSRRLAGALRSTGVEPGDRVAYLSPNTHSLLEGHFGVPAARAVLVAMNTRLATEEFAYILDHSGARLLVFDVSLEEEARGAVEQADRAIRLVEAGHAAAEYEHLLAEATPLWEQPLDETDALSINYTSGTTGRPKGVVYHHRGAFLQAVAMAYHARLDSDSVYLWTLPMFHTNGWTFPWAVTAAGAKHRCLRRVDPAVIWDSIRDEGVTHLCGAPTVLLMMSEHESAGGGSPRRVSVMTGGAPPTPALIERLGTLGIDVIHLYGLTETYGPAALCEWRSEWNDLSPADRAVRKARQGVANIIGAPVRVVDDDGVDVPSDGQTIGEIALTGNNVMARYHDDPAATARAIPDGWFRTGDLAVMHADGYVEIRDRKKDIIISGGENISSVEVERVLAAHPTVYEAAVIGRPDPKWGEVPIAVVELRSGEQASEDELIDHVRNHLAHFKAPKAVVFSSLPRTSTGKIQKHQLRALIDGE